MRDRLNKDMPLVCICIPVRNGANTIGDTIRSLLNQDYSNFEILICDNLSTDDTKQVIDDIISKSHIKIRYILNPIQGSAEENWNFLLNNLPNYVQYVALYHADDIYLSSIVSKQLQLLKDTGVGAVFTQSRLINEKGEDVTRVYNHKTELPTTIRSKVIFDYQDLLNLTLRYNNFIRTPSFFFDVGILKNYHIYFDKQFKTSADLEFWLRISNIDKIAILDEPLLLYRISRTQGTFTLLRNRQELADYFKVMDYHVRFTNNKDVIKWYTAWKSMELIFCSINLISDKKKHNAKLFLNPAINLKHIPQLNYLPNGLTTYIVGLGLRFSMFLNLEQRLVMIVNRFRRF